MGEYSHRNVDSRQPSFHMFIDKQALLAADKKYIELTKKNAFRSFPTGDNWFG